MAVKIRFDDCPYNCNPEGKLLDSVTGNLVNCPYCSKKRRDLLVSEAKIQVDDASLKGILNEDTIEKINKGEVGVSNNVDIEVVLGLKNVHYLSDLFSYDAVVSPAVQRKYDSKRVEMHKSALNKLYEQLCLGELPEYSYCIGLPDTAKLNYLIYPYMIKSYLAGLSIAKCVSAADFTYRYINGTLDDEIKMQDYFDCDIVIMVIQSGVSIENLN